MTAGISIQENVVLGTATILCRTQASVTGPKLGKQRPPARMLEHYSALSVCNGKQKKKDENYFGALAVF